MLAPVSTLAQDAGDFVSRELSRFSAGIVCTPVITLTRPAPDTVAGFTNVSPSFPPFSTVSRRVPMLLGISFGARTQSKAQDFDPVQIVVTHPPMGDEGVTRQSWESSIFVGGEGGTYFSLEFDYELVEGPWTLEAWSGNEQLYRAEFEVVPPQDVPELATICGFEDLLS